MFLLTIPIPNKLKTLACKITLSQLFWNFFLIGSLSFGGHMALVAMVRKQLVEKLKVLKDEQVLEGASLAAMLPGPLAVNSVVYYGYILHGIRGAFASFFGVLLPTTLLVLVFAAFYFSVSQPDQLHIDYVIPAVAAIIAGVGISMGKQQIRFWSQGILALLALLISVFASHVLFLIGTLFVGGLAGYLLYFKSDQQQSSQNIPEQAKTLPDIKQLVVVLLSIAFVLGILAGISGNLKTSLSLATVFSGMSLTLFGGGYVIIPIMKQALVSDLSWVSLSEFNAAIGISQVTPGPILSSVTFIGYKLAGISGAITATLAIFLPSGVIMLLVASLHERIKHQAAITAMMTGIRSVVIGLIVSGAYTVGIASFGTDVFSWGVFVLALGATLFTKIHPSIIIGITLAISFI